jgi:hypothetical protein
MSNLILAVDSGPSAVLNDIRYYNTGGGTGEKYLPNLVQEFNTLDSGLVGDPSVGFARCKRVLYVMCASTTENDNVEKRVGTEAVSPVYRDTSGLSCSVQARNNLILAILVDREHFSSVFSGDATHFQIDEYGTMD